MKPGPRNLITDVAGLRVGNSEDHTIKTGTTVLVADKPFRASVDVMGGSPGSRETELLAPDKLVEEVDALVLSGGSAFGLDAASGVSDGLRKLGRGFRVEKATVPIVPGAIIFDLLNNGDKDWDENPYRALGARALANAGETFALGTAGAGVGALTANLKGGLGSASLVIPGGFTVGALVVANPTGSVTMGDSKHFWAAPFEADGEFGGFGPLPGPMPGMTPPPPPVVGPPPPMAPGAWSLDRREDWIQQRINQGRMDGSLDRREAARAQRTLNEIRATQAQLTRRGHGRLSDTDRIYIEQRLDRLRDGLHWMRDNGERAPWMRP